MSNKPLLAVAVITLFWMGLGVGLSPAPAEEAGPAGAKTQPPRVQKERLMQALKELQHPEPLTRQKAVEYLGQAGDMSVVKRLASALADPHPQVREQAEKSMWMIWLRSGDPDTDKILYMGMELMASGQLQNAINAFRRVIERAPDFAEGYNKRATALYLADRYKESLVDCDTTLRLNPHHFGAQFGKGLNYLKLRDFPKALLAFRQTLKILPYSESARSIVNALEERLKPQGKEL
ncbi:MAG: tetratricopeptide repeat protein [Nitrospinota bacterium]